MHSEESVEKDECHGARGVEEVHQGRHCLSGVHSEEFFLGCEGDIFFKTPVGRHSQYALNVSWVGHGFCFFQKGGELFLFGDLSLNLFIFKSRFFFRVKNIEAAHTVGILINTHCPSIFYPQAVIRTPKGVPVFSACVREETDPTGPSAGMILADGHTVGGLIAIIPGIVHKETDTVGV